MNPAKKKQTIRRLVIAALVLLALVAAVVLIARQMRSETVNVFNVSEVSDTYWGDSTELSGMVSEGSVDNIPLAEGMVESFAVQVGDEVKKGDVLLKYDTSSYQLTLSSDQAQIAMLQSQIAQAQQEISAYRRMTPSEAVTPPPAPTPKPTPRTVSVVETTTPPDEQLAGVEYYNCTVDTVVRADVLKLLASSVDQVAYRLYEGRDLLGLWFVSGEDLARYGEEWAPEDWTLGEGLTLNGDGTISISLDAPRYGTFESRLPGGDGDDDYDPWPIDPGSGYSAAEIAQMIRDAQASIQTCQRQLQQAQLKYKRDQLTGQSGEVKASDDGVVTFIADPHTIAAGQTLITVKGSANAIVTVYVDELSRETLRPGDEVSVMSYETGANFIAKVDSVGSEPSQEYSYDPSSSMYPVTCVAEESDLELNVGEYCSVTPMQEQEVSDHIYLPMYFVREDDQGSYVLAAGENGRLERRAISTGKIIWGSSIEILRGVTVDDQIAFPYGRSARPGNRTQHAELDQLYGY